MKTEVKTHLSIARAGPLSVPGCLVAAVLMSSLCTHADDSIPYSIRTLRGIELSEKKVERIRNTALGVVRQRIAKHHGDDELVRVSHAITSAEPCMEFLSSREEGKQWIVSGRRSVDNALAYWRSPHLIMPEARFVVPLEAREIDSSVRSSLDKDNVVVLNLLKFVGNRYASKLTMIYRTRQNKTLNMGFTIHNAGEFRLKFTPVQDEQGKRVRCTRESAAWSLGEADKFSLHETPAHEVLHCQLSPHTISHILKQDVFKEIDPSGLTHLQKATISKHMKAEEVVVDGLSGAWLSNYLKKVRIDAKPSFGSPASKALAASVAHVTPQELIELYVEKGPLYVVATYAKHPKDTAPEALTDN